MDRSRTKLVLVHGVGANRLHMWPLAQRLRAVGFSVSNWGYSSLWSRIERHGERLASFLAELDEDHQFDSTVLVGHSMGCIVSRSAINVGKPAKLNRAIFLAPPNRGSPVADFFAPWLGWVNPPARQLRTSPDSFVNQLPDELEIPLGVIAAKVDLLVPLHSTYLRCQSDHISIGGMHSVLPLRKDVAKLIESFIANRQFASEADREHVDQQAAAQPE